MARLLALLITSMLLFLLMHLPALAWRVKVEVKKPSLSTEDSGKGNTDGKAARVNRLLKNCYDSDIEEQLDASPLDAMKLCCKMFPTNDAGSMLRPSRISTQTVMFGIMCGTQLRRCNEALDKVGTIPAPIGYWKLKVQCSKLESG